MARKNSNARRRWRRRRTYVDIPRAVILPVHKKLDDGVSPGRLVAIAEWREAR